MKAFFFLFFLCAAFAGSFTAARYYQAHKPHSELKKQTSVSFQAAPFAAKNRPFTIVITGMNNGASVAKTLNSVFNQNYDNFRVIYVDDASDDGSFDLVRDLVLDSPRLGQVNLVQNEKRLGPLANLYRAVQTCSAEEIVVVLNGEDWLAHEWVLQRLNAYYADPDLWLTYGQYCDFPTYQLGNCREMKEGKVRNLPFLASHLKTFYAGLFKKVKESDLIYQGKFLPSCGELAYMIPMMEMAQNHFHFISEILYITNRQVVVKEDRELQMRCEKAIRSLDSYAPLACIRDPER